MLSQHDRHALAEIEAELRASDPELARTLDGTAPEPPEPPATPHRRPRLVWLVVGTILLATSFAVHNADLAFLAGGIILADLSVWITVRVAAGMRRRAGSRR